MPAAEIIAIGTELLLGQTQDTNTAYIARLLNDAGFDIFRASMVGDNENRIATSIRESLERAEVVITTGGLGPTVDDPTRGAVALAFGVNLEYHPELWEEIQERFRAYSRSPSENNKRQAHLPAGAVAIHNPVGTAPAFYLEKGGRLVVSLPGVPSEMKTLLHDDVIPLIREKYHLKSVIVTRVIHTVGIGESSVDELIGDMEKLANPTVGLAAHPGQVDIRVTAKAADRQAALDQISPIESRVYSLLEEHIYGSDEMTLENVVKELIGKYHLNPVVFFHDGLRELSETLCRSLDVPCETIGFSAGKAKHYKMLKDNQSTPNQLTILMENPSDGEQGVDLRGILMNNEYRKSLRFGGHSELYAQWANNQILNFLRVMIKKRKR